MSKQTPQSDHQEPEIDGVRALLGFLLGMAVGALAIGGLGWVLSRIFQPQEPRYLIYGGGFLGMVIGGQLGAGFGWARALGMGSVVIGGVVGSTLGILTEFAGEFSAGIGALMFTLPGAALYFYFALGSLRKRQHSKD